MAEVIEDGRAIRLEAKDRRSRRREWRPWKSKGYRVPAPDGLTVRHERDAIRLLVLEFFRDLDADVFLFGSRGAGGGWEGSDYDIGFRTRDPVPAGKLSQLRESLEDLPIPSRVELVDFGAVPGRFAELVLQGKRGVEIWKTGRKSSLFT
ncbi:MAG: nucleotidyltransferase domain-containing protein [Deferrisomatales bacterium]|nr:nucleotidyltransferase domain-containing protein [Deferrisomatales bacterium]